MSLFNISLIFRWKNTHDRYQKHIFSPPKTPNSNGSAQNWKEETHFILCDDVRSSQDTSLSQSRTTNYRLYRSFKEGNTQSRIVQPKRKNSLNVGTSETIPLRQFVHSGGDEWPNRVLISVGENQKLSRLKRLKVAAQCMVDVYQLLKDISYVYNDIFYE